MHPNQRDVLNWPALKYMGDTSVCLRLPSLTPWSRGCHGLNGRRKFSPSNRVRDRKMFSLFTIINWFIYPNALKIELNVILSWLSFMTWLELCWAPSSGQSSNSVCVCGHVQEKHSCELGRWTLISAHGWGYWGMPYQPSTTQEPTALTHTQYRQGKSHTNTDITVHMYKLFKGSSAEHVQSSQMCQILNKCF